MMRATKSTVLIFLLNIVYIENNDGTENKIVASTEKNKNKKIMNPGNIEILEDSQPIDAVTDNRNYTEAGAECTTNCDRPPIVLLPIFIKMYRYPQNVTKSMMTNLW